MQRITAKLGTMRKAAEWVVYPSPHDGAVGLVIQSDHRIARIYPETGKGILSVHKGSGAYFVHLNGILGATVIDVPQDVIDAALAAQPKSGDEIGPGVRVA